MEIVKKPDARVFASNAKTGEILAFPDVLRGWGVTLDQTQGKPPLEWMNDAFNRIDLNNLYLLQQGIPEWDEATRYPINSIIKHADKLYLCIAENENNEPSANSEKWALYIRNASEKDSGILKLATQSEVDAGTDDTKSVTPKKLAEKLKKLPDASLTKKGITQLTNTIDDSEDKAMTPKGINEIKIRAERTPLPVKDQILIGQDDEKFKLINIETLKTLLNIKNGLPIGHVHWHMFNISGSLPLDGREVSRADHPDLFNFAKFFMLSDSDWWASASGNWGQCAYFSSGNGSTTFRLPTVTKYVKGGGTGYQHPGLPNIYGQIDSSGLFAADNTSASGAFSLSNFTNTSSSTAITQSHHGLTFSAQSSNGIYGSSSTVEVIAVTGFWQIKAF